MLGEKVGEERGKITGQRVLPSEGMAPKVETSFEATGSILGVNHKTLGTYQAVMRPDGTLLGEGQGIVMGAGGEAGTWKGQGVGKFGPGGSVSYRGAIYYQSASPAWARLNGVAAVFEYEVDAAGASSAQIWEWK